MNSKRSRVIRAAPLLGVCLVVLLLMTVDALQHRAAAQERQPRRSVLHAQCYDIHLGAWTPRMKLGDDSAFVLPPRRISVAPNETGAWRPIVELARDVRAIENRPGSMHHRGYWRRLPDDSAQVVFTTGFSGVRLSVHRAGDNWRGVAETFWDFDRASQRAPVTLVYRACPST